MATSKPNPVTGLPAPLSGFDVKVALQTAPAWRPEPGEKLVGIPVATRVGTSKDFPDYPVLLIQTLDGDPVAFHAFHTLAQNRLKELKAEIIKAAKNREVMTFLYLGSFITNETKGKEPKDQTSYHNYFIDMGRPEDVTADEPSFDF